MRVSRTIAYLTFLVTAAANAQSDRDSPRNHRDWLSASEGRARPSSDASRIRDDEMVSMEITDRSMGKRPVEGAVSLGELLHKAPAAAMRAYKKALGARAKHDEIGAREQLRAAVELDPDFTDALTELGCVHASLGNPQDGLEPLEKAVKLDPNHPRATTSLAMVLFSIGRYVEAGNIARRALKFGHTTAKLQYVLAIGLMVDRGDPAEALYRINRAAEDLPEVRLSAADVLVQQGRRADAAAQLEKYLASGGEQQDRQKVESWLASLRQ